MAPCARGRSAGGMDLALGPRSPKPPGTRMPWKSSDSGAGSSFSNTSLSIHSSLDPDPVGDPAMDSASFSRLVGILEAWVCCRRWRWSPRLPGCGWRRHPPHCRSRWAAAPGRTRPKPRVEPLPVIGHRRRRCRRSCAWITAFADVAEQRDLAASGRDRRSEHVGGRPADADARNSLTECWVGLVLELARSPG